MNDSVLLYIIHDSSNAYVLASFYKYSFEIVKHIFSNLWDLYNEMGRTLKTVFHISFISY
jgi:hypothetical protein